MEDKKIINQNRSEFFSKMLKVLAGVLLLIFLPKKIFGRNLKPLEVIEIKEHPHSVKRRNKGK
ncbi:MAG: hypothetical protein KJ666_13225 [Bacteroidetes bacterium]|nr:hypothetical protein [Bacteroidota bacterium]